MARIQHGGILQKGEIWTPTHREGRLNMETEVDWGDASTSQGTPRISRRPPGARREACSRLRRNQPFRHLGLRLLLPELGADQLLLFKPPSLCCFFRQPELTEGPALTSSAAFVLRGSDPG